MSESKYIKIDFRQMARSLGEHFSQVAPEEHTAWCDCGTELYQVENKCSGCGTPVVWVGSDAWQDKFGSAKEYIRELNAIKPIDRAGKYLIEKAGLPGFKDRTEIKRWNYIISVINQPKAIAIIDRCARKTRGRGLIKYTLNAAEKAIERMPADTIEGEIRSYL